MSGELLISWGAFINNSMLFDTRTAGTGGTWGTPASVGTTFKIQAQDLQLAPEPGTNYIAYANIGDYNGVDGAYAEAAMWDGGAWANINNYDNAVSTLAISLTRTSVAWLQSGGQSRAVVVYDDSASSGLDWLYFNKNTSTWSAIQADYTGAPAPSATGAAGAMYLASNPFNAAQATYITVDGQSDLFTKRLVFDGTNLTWSSIEPSGAVLEASIPTKVGWSASFAYNAYVPPVGSLSVDVVDASGITVASPSVSMGNIAASGLCQTSTGTLGVTAQKIRISNTTINPAWTVSIAATAGATTSWSSGGAVYDFNDASGSPAGCGDGADADSIAGQLNIDPSVSTITPQAGCTSTGLSKGSSSAFSQAVIDNLTLMSASASAGTNCYWDLTGMALSQKVPELQPSGGYALPMTITVVAN